MEFNYLKTSMLSAMAVGALAFSASMSAAAPVSVVPAEGTVESLQNFTLVFNSEDVVAWSFSDTDMAPALSLNGEVVAYGGPANIVADGNKLSVNLSTVYVNAGEYELSIKAGSYTVNGEAGDACSYKWTVSGSEAVDMTVDPAADVVNEIQYVTITFNEASEVTLAEDLGTDKTPYLYIITDDGVREGRGAMYPSVSGNVMNLRMNTPIYDEGEYVIEVPGSVYFLDGKAGEDFTLNYKVVAPAYPEVELSVNPATDKVETIETIELTFGGVDIVEWAVIGTENAPYIEDLDGNRVGTFFDLSGLGNMLSMTINGGFAMKGEYKVVIPEGSYMFQGIYHGMPGKQIELSFEVLGLSGMTVEPSANVVNEIQYVSITFNEASEVTLAEDLGTDKSPYLYLLTEDGIREGRGAMFPSVQGNVMNLRMNTPIYDEGEYVIVVPGSVYFLDGNPGEDFELNYNVVAPAYPEVELDVNPATDKVETIETIEVTFGGVDLVEWAVTGTENAPYIEDLDGNRVGTFFDLSGLGNMLSMTINGGFAMKGEYKVVIPEGSYLFQGIYHGMPGKQIELSYEVLGLSGMTVEPSANVVNEIQYVTITFNEASEVTLAEDLGTDKTPYLYLLTEDGVREGRGAMFPSVQGNVMNLRMNTPIYDEGEYVIVVPGSVYFLDGNQGEDFELNYKVVAPSYPEVELSVNPATDKVETIETIEVTFGGVDTVEWAVTGTENAPYIEDLDGNRVGTFFDLNGQGNTLSMTYRDGFAKKGEYKVVIPEGAYVFQGIYHGMPGNKIELSYEVLGLTGIDVEPSANVLNEIQYVTITFNEANEVTLAEDLNTENAPYLYLINDEGEREGRGMMMPSVSGNKMNLRMNTPIYDEGEYVIVVPGSCYFLDGSEGETIELNYTVVAPSYPDVELSVNPDVDAVETIETIELTFGGVDIVEWKVDGTENAPYIEDLDGNRVATFYNLSGLGNMLSMTINDGFAVKGEYKVVIPEGSYVFQGIYRGMPGKEITLSYEVLGLSGITVEPAVNVLSEIQNIKITFNEATEVTLAEELSTENTPYLYLINEEGQREGRGAMFPAVFGNTMILTMNTPITDEGEYVVVIPGTVYFLDGNEGADIELSYTVVPDVTAKYTVEPNEGTVNDLHTVTITFPESEVAFWNVKEINADSSIAPSVTLNGAPIYVDGEVLTLSLYSNGNAISAAVDQANTLTEAGYYVFNIPAASYFVEGSNSVDIILAYILDPAASDDPNAVNAIFGGKTSMNVYDINGRIVLRNAAPAEVMGLRGIFVIDGKKYILR